MHKTGTLIGILLLLSPQVKGQQLFELGAEGLKSFGKGYSTTKVAARGENFTNKNSFSAGITWQLASQKSYSVSTGFGFYIGYRHAFGNNLKGSNPFGGGRLLFSLEDFEGKTKQKSLLITPMVEAGYHFVFAKRIYTAPSLGFGYTVEISKGYNSLNEDVGKRFIPSLSAGYRF
ncbi:MAG: hypothetical protein HYZ15_05430 [Sphingobacteriales bacterium]|nr:hypothetical protein [Sphingobacteriales bacterium]